MKTAILVILIPLIAGCAFSKRTGLNTNASMTNEKIIPQNTPIEISIKNVDSSSVDLYNIVRFTTKETKSSGIILEKKSAMNRLISGQKLTVKLCDIGQYQYLFRESDTTSIGNVPIIYGKQDGLKDKVDTLSLRGHFMINGQILTDNNLVLDFADDAKEPVFEVCGN